ncbi:uncharacterized protein LOC106142159 [Amyelois transitella]|uniref:uncharacterized protein LOC106142159 n=1 Tax=Amyelois transitella TaxID=680683 RepID=UPI00067CB5DE|nr:uncharacterized protein LOC106142159 [Amyelois transitella]XP_013199274.1 uncharacterized protein LOC106142159 [Amyelois transitella]
MSSNLEAEDFNVPLVRMEDVQPDIYCMKEENDLETYIDDDLEYDNEFIVDNDEDSNIGSMVSIHSEEVPEDSDSAEVIVPEVLDSKIERKPVIIKENYEEINAEKNLDSWPTLEILPGGVIKRGEKCNTNLTTLRTENELSSEYNNANIYACAKCSQSFKFLFCLVKHVRMHEEIAKRKHREMAKLVPGPKETKFLKLTKRKAVAKTCKKKVPIRNKTKS